VTIGSFGDFAGLAILRTRPGRTDLAVPLSRLLDDTHARQGSLTPAVRAAIDDIRAH